MTNSIYLKSFNKKYLKYGNIYKIGNKKIGNDTIIFNIDSATNCISKKLGLCQLPDTKQCYALRAEIQYKQTLEYRKRQNKFWDAMNLIDFINDIIKIKDKYPNIKYLRFNEAGDIRNINDLRYICFIALKLKTYGIKVYTYTARIDLYQLIKTGSNDLKEFISNSEIIINGSGFMWHNKYKTSNNIPPNNLKCPGNCKNCKLCKTRMNKTINVEIF